MNRKKIIIISSIIAIVLLLPFGTLKVTSLPQFCAFCHEIKPEYVTWKGSAHSQVNCTVCHIDPGFVNEVEYKAKASKRIYTHFAKKYLLPLTMERNIPDETCQKCHSFKRHITPSGDIKVPHKKHFDRKIHCIQCHRGVAHGNIVTRQMTIDGDFKIWTEAFGKAQMVRQFTGLSMKACMECHTKRKASLACEACHKEITTPDNHKTKEWVRDGVHGQLARKNLDYCDKCHSYTNTFETVMTQDKVARYARTNSYCKTCHLKRPEGHGKDWQAVHKSKARINRDGCLVCHSSRPPARADNVTKTFCIKCHTGRHQLFNENNHPVKLIPDAGIQGYCLKCHSTRTCGKCHYVEKLNEQYVDSNNSKLKENVTYPPDLGQNYRRPVPKSQAIQQ